MEQRHRAVILARVSSKAQEDEGYSLDSQVKLLQGYCQSRALTIVKVFKIAETASKDQSRKTFQELLDFIAKNKIYHLAVEKTDRLTRNLHDAVAIDDWLSADAERRLHAVKENLLLHKDARSDVKFMWNIHLAVAKKYTDNLREEAMKGWAEKLAQGWLPAVPPPGYMTITEKGKRIHVPDPKTKAAIQHVFKKYLEPGQTIASIAQEMSRLGISTRHGRPYYKSKVQDMLTNPFYTGINRFNGKEYPGMQEPIISEDVFERVQYKMHKKRPRAYAKHYSPLKGLIRCQDCGTVVTWQLQKGRYYGACRRDSPNCKMGKLLKEDEVEAELVGLLERLVCPSPAIIEWVSREMRAQSHEDVEAHGRLVASTEAQLKRVAHMDDCLYDDKLAGEITKERYDEKHEQFIKQKAELTAQLAQLDQPLGQRLEHKLTVLELTQKAAELYKAKPAEKKRLILSKLFSKLTLKDGQLSVEYTDFAKVIASKVQATHKLLEERRNGIENYSR